MIADVLRGEVEFVPDHVRLDLPAAFDVLVDPFAVLGLEGRALQ